MALVVVGWWLLVGNWWFVSLCLRVCTCVRASEWWWSAQVMDHVRIRRVCASENTQTLHGTAPLPPQNVCGLRISL